MTLNNIKSIRKDRGFTIVELLIVIVVIAILAAITIVAYNGIQSRSKNSAAATNVNNVVKKAEAANSLAGSYPTTVAAFDAYSESKITASGIGLGTPTAATGTTTSSYEVCTAGAANGGARVRAWDYTTNALSTTYTYVGPASGGAACTTWAATLTVAP